VINNIKGEIIMGKKGQLIAGIGINDYEGSMFAHGKILKPYYTWQNMIMRCYDPKKQIKTPSYIGCSVVEEWHRFSVFKQWFDINYREAMHLDKDILIQGNKVYGPKSCRFIPGYINNLFLCPGEARKKFELPLGVTKKGSYFLSTVCRGSDDRLKKRFKNLQDAVAWYSITKTEVVRSQATKAFEAGDIGEDVFEALLERKF